MTRSSTHFNNDLRYRDGNHPAQWQFTPHYVLDRVRIDLGGIIGLDPCTTPDNPVGAEKFYAPPVDGLVEPWDADTIFVNPPYGKAREPWVERCIAAAKPSVPGERGRPVVLLIPAATDTRIFAKAASGAWRVVFIVGRVKFGTLRGNGRQHAASHPSALIGWNTMLGSCASLGYRMSSAGLAL